jgi:hypothetical protein
VFDRAFRGAVTTTVGAAIALTGTFLPWLRSGSRDRSSYTIFDLVERLGFAPGGVVAWSLRLWPLVPLLLVTMAVAGWAVATGHLRWPPAAVAIGTAIVWIGGTAVALVLAPDAGLFRVGNGPAVAVAGVLVSGLGGVWLRPRGSAASGAV